MALPFFGIGMKTDLSSPVATAEFSKFADILSAALSHQGKGMDLFRIILASPKSSEWKSV